MSQQIKKWFILPGDYASPACNKNKAICVSIQKHNTLIINKYQNVHSCMTKVYILIIHHKLSLFLRLHIVVATLHITLLCFRPLSLFLSLAFFPFFLKFMCIPFL